MMIPFWLVYVVIIGAAIWLLIYAVQINRKNELSCVTCGKYHSDKSSLSQCEICNGMVCSDVFEVIEEVSTTSNVVIEVNPSDTNPAYPCGIVVFKDNEVHIYCKKDEPRIQYKHSIYIQK